MDGVHVANFMAIPKEDLTFEICVLSSAGKLIRIDGAGTRTELGKISQGQFVPLSSQECAIEMMRLIKEGVESASRVFCKLQTPPKK